jgi:tRNA threonylcarbamoyladenosine biosynthesis protein TsaB
MAGSSPGRAAARIAQEAGGGLIVGLTEATADIGVYAGLGAAKPADEKPKPLYLRDADAKPQGGFILPRIRS